MLSVLTTLASDYSYTYNAPSASASSSAGMSPVMLVFWGLVGILVIVSSWIIYRKAGRPGWAAIVPIYNDLQLLWLVGRPWWWIVLMAIPVVNIVFAVIVMHDLSKSFGKGVGTTLLLFFLPFIGFPLLAFGKAQYQGPSALKAAPADAGTPTAPTAPTTPASPTGTTPPANLVQ